MVATLQPADAVMLVIDMNDPECIEQIPAIMAQLAAKKIFLIEHWPGLPGGADRAPASDDPFRLDLPTLLVVNKRDLDSEPGEVQALKELLGLGLPALSVSAETGQGLNELGPFLFRALEIVRVYTKSPGKPADTETPFTLKRGETVLDIAKLVHRDIADGLKFARVWGRNVFDGQQCGPEHAVDDGDLVELHF